MTKPLVVLFSISYCLLGIVIYFSAKLPIIYGLPLICISIIGATLFVTKRIVNPLSELQQIAESLSAGEFKNQFPWSESREISQLVTAISNMAIQLEDRFLTILNERNEKEAILNNMTEGVLLLDQNKRIISANLAAKRLMDVESQDIKGLIFSEIFRNSDIQAQVTQTYTGNTHQFSHILNDFQQKTLQVQGMSLTNAAQDILGVLIMLHDLTPIKQLDAIRKDFVANVSHELKTPITLIKGALETLEDSTLNQEDTAHFLQMAKTHTDQLDQLLEELLNLARLEQTNTKIEKTSTPISEIVDNILPTCKKLANDKEIALTVSNIPAIPLHCNAQLVQQALINLIKNAIQHSNCTQIILSVDENPLTITLRVADNGSGIEKNHLDRLFERFYRVDKARNRQNGGTGLGLSLVKHIMYAHSGKVEVQSELQKGSIFTLVFSKD